MGVADDLGSTTQKFSNLFAKLQPAAGVQLNTATLAGILNQAGPDRVAKTNQLADHLAKNTSLTLAGARPMVSYALENTANDEEAAAQVSQQVANLVGSADLELSNPIPLNGWFRAGFAVVMAAVTTLSVVFIFISHAKGTAEFVALGVIGGFGWLGTVLFVMGYQNVSVKGSTGTPAAAPTT